MYDSLHMFNGLFSFIQRCSETLPNWTFISNTSNSLYTILASDPSNIKFDCQYLSGRTKRYIDFLKLAHNRQTGWFSIGRKTSQISKNLACVLCIFQITPTFTFTSIFQVNYRLIETIFGLCWINRFGDSMVWDRRHVYVSPSERMVLKRYRLFF